MSGNDDESQDMDRSTESEGEPSETRSGPGLGGVPPEKPLSSGWGGVDDDGRAHAMVEALDAGEGSSYSRDLSLGYFDIEERRHRVWRAIPPSDSKVSLGDVCSFPNYVVYAVEHERDHL